MVKGSTNMKTQTITRRKFTGRMWVLIVLVLITMWTLLGLLIPFAYWYFASEVVVEEVKAR